MQFKPFDPDLETIRYRRNLPHWCQLGATYFVTFRTADSIPELKLRCMREQKSIWLRNHPPPWTIEQWTEHHGLMFDRLDRWLDANCGACPMKDPKTASMVANSMKYFDNSRYCLDEFVVMPNHVHAIVLPFEGHEIDEVLHSWKSYTAQRINLVLGKKGTFWLHENYDRIVRDHEELERIREYIRLNPVKAGLRSGEYVLGSGSGILIGPS